MRRPRVHYDVTIMMPSLQVLLCGESQYGVRCEGDEGAVSTFSPVQGLEAGTYQQVHEAFSV